MADAIAAKRPGRSPLHLSPHSRVVHQRQQGAKASAAYRRRKREQQGILTAPQSEQQVQVLESHFEDDQPQPTSLSLGLRVDEINLPRDDELESDLQALSIDDERPDPCSPNEPVDDSDDGIQDLCSDTASNLSEAQSLHLDNSGDDRSPIPGYAASVVDDLSDTAPPNAAEGSDSLMSGAIHDPVKGEDGEDDDMGSGLAGLPPLSPGSSTGIRLPSSLSTNDQWLEDGGAFRSSLAQEPSASPMMVASVFDQAPESTDSEPIWDPTKRKRRSSRLPSPRKKRTPTVEVADSDAASDSDFGDVPSQKRVSNDEALSVRPSHSAPSKFTMPYTSPDVVEYADLTAEDDDPGFGLPSWEELLAPPLPEQTGSDNTVDFATHEPGQRCELHEEDTERSSVDETAEKIVTHLRNFQGCSEHDHQQRLAKHNRHTSGTHFNLDATYHPAMPNVMKRYTEFASSPRQCTPLESAVEMDDAYCGVGTDSLRARKICLHREKTQDSPAHVRFDVDSYLGFAFSPAFARKGLFYQPSPNMKSNIVSDLHLDRAKKGVPQNERRSEPEQIIQDIRKTPHCHFGTLQGDAYTAVYVLFPHLPVKGEKFTALTGKQLQRWTDEVVLPAINRTYEAHYSQYFPPSYENADLDAHARQREGRKTGTQSYGSKQSLNEFLQPELLGVFWQHVLATIDQGPNLQDFRDVQFFFTKKGMKREYKTNADSPSLPTCIDRFETDFEANINLDFVVIDRLFVDLAKEVCPAYAYSPKEHVPAEQKPQTYLFRRCCLEHFIPWMFGDDRQGRQTLYTVAMLGEAANLTCVPALTSDLAQGGLQYLQFYGTYKTMFDAAKCYPFANDGVEELALDLTVRKAAGAIGGAPVSDVRYKQEAYLKSKQRVYEATRRSGCKAFAAREELRLRYDLLLAIRDKWARYRVPPPTELSAAPAYVWTVYTKRWCRFLQQAANKFAAGFEYLYTSCARKRVRWEQTAIMVMHLRCLRFALVGHDFAREGAMWWGARQLPSNGETRYGLGFSATSQQFNYCWLRPRVNWVTARFQARYRGKMLFGNHLLSARYHTNWAAVSALDEEVNVVDRLEEWLRRYRRPAQQDLIQRGLVHHCLRQWRRDVMAKTNVDVSGADLDEDREALPTDEIFLCFDWIYERTQQQPFLVTGNRVEVKRPQDMFELLFGPPSQPLSFGSSRTGGSGKKTLREHWGGLPFRMLFLRARDIIDRCYHDDDRSKAWGNLFCHELFEYHWLYPMPSLWSGTLVQKTEKRQCAESQVKWWSLKRQVEFTSAKRQACMGWQWGGKEWQSQRPQCYPKYLHWNEEEWRRHLEKLS